MPNFSLVQHNLAAHLSTAIMVLDQELCLQYINTAAEALLEISLPKSKGLYIDRFITANSIPPAELASALSSERPFTYRERVLEFNTSQNVTADYTVTPFKEEQSGEEFLLIEIQPLDRLLRISREKSQLSNVENTKNLVRSLAHEIKNPLGGLRGAAQLLERQLQEPALKDYTQIIISEADRLTALVDQLLGPRSKPNKSPLNIHEVLERVYALSSAETGDAIEFQRDYDPSLPLINADKAQLIQAILNIVRNAMQALSTNPSQEKPTITLRSRCQRQFTINNEIHKILARIDIDDNGPGIPDHLQECLFLPTITGRAEGSGLGLSISQAIIVQHQGLLAFQSKPGQTQFTIYLPVEQNT